MNIINIIDEVQDHKDQQRDWESVKGIMLHRAGVNLVDNKLIGYDGLTVAKAFTGRLPEWEEVARATNRQNAYTFMIGTDCDRVNPKVYDGEVWQALALDEIGWHARRFSRGWLGMCWLGDPRVRRLSEASIESAVSLCATLCMVRGWDPTSAIRGHGEVTGAHGGDKAPGAREACPGLSKKELDDFRALVAKRIESIGTCKLSRLGIVVSAD